MRFLNYLFWRLSRSKVTAHSYFNATLALGVIVTLIVFLSFDIPYEFIHYELINEDSRLYDYILWFVLGSIFSIPFRLIFPKKKIENLNFTEKELKKNKIIFRGIIIFLLLAWLIIRIWYKYKI